MDALLKLRTHYTKLANQELARMRGLSSGNPIKSITTGVTNVLEKEKN